MKQPSSPPFPLLIRGWCFGHKSSHSFARTGCGFGEAWRVGGWFQRDGSEEGLDGSTGAPPSQEAWLLRPSAARRLSEKKLQHVLAQKWNNLRFTANLNSK